MRIINYSSTFSFLLSYSILQQAGDIGLKEREVLLSFDDGPNPVIVEPESYDE